MHEPDGAKARYNRAEAYRFRRSYCRAIGDYAAALALRPGYIDAWLGRGIAMLRLGEPEAATEDLSSVLAREPLRIEALFIGNGTPGAGQFCGGRPISRAPSELAPFNPVIAAAGE